MKKPLAIALVGGIVAAFSQRFTPTGWWLNSGQGVAIIVLVLSLLAVPVSAAAGSWPWQSRSVVWPGALWAGANIGLAIVLFRVGPGNIFPIVLVVGAGISAIAVGAGSLFGALARALWRLWRG
jgi:hypothetical protein